MTRMATGFDKPLYVLPFDHRGTFKKNMFGWSGTLTTEQTDQIVSFKQVIYEALQAAVGAGVSRETAGVLVDEQYGAAILRDARKKGYFTALTTEKSGQAEFDFEYGEDFPKHIETFNPTFAKVLVRYNPESDAALNERQATRLKLLSDFLHAKSRSLFMFELLVLPEKAQMDKLNGDKRAYDVKMRPSLMVRAIHELQDAGVEPDVWKIEGLERTEDCEKVVAAARRDGRQRVGCIVLGRGEDDKKVGEWLVTAAHVPGFIGFAVGRTVFWSPLEEWRDKKITREEAVNKISRRYQKCVSIFDEARGSLRFEEHRKLA